MFTPCPITDLKDYNVFTFEDISERQWEWFNLCWTNTIKSMRKDINKFVKNIVVRFIVLGLLNQIEKDLLRFRNNPNGLRQKYSNLNLNGLKLLKYLIND